MKLRVGVLSDTHLRQVNEGLRRIRDRYLSGLDAVLHAGDFVSADIVRFLSGGEFYGVHGNMDPPEVRAMLPDRRVIELGPYRIGLIHGWGASEGLEKRILPCFEGVDAIVYGHSHRAANHVTEGVLLFNPGTAAGSRASPSLGILSLDRGIQGEVVYLG
jgi:putative phosphoesterase